MSLEAYLRSNGSEDRFYFESEQLLAMTGIYRSSLVFFGKLVEIQHGPRHCKRGEPEQAGH